MLSQDSREVVTDEEIAKIVFAEMVIEEFSINPELKDFLIIIQEDSPQQVIDRVKQIDPNCEIKEGTLNRTSQPISSPPGAGTLGSDHSHAAILVKIFGDSFDFLVPAYQIQASWIHFESASRDTSGVPPELSRFRHLWMESLGGRWCSDPYTSRWRELMLPKR